MRKEEFTQAEWDAIHAVPITVFAFVATADGSIHEKELRTFREDWRTHMNRTRFSDDETIDMFIKGVLEDSIRSELPVITQEKVRDKLAMFRMAVKHRPEAKPLKRAFATLAQDVANASGSLFGKNVLKEEQKAVDFVINAL